MFAGLIRCARGNKHLGRTRLGSVRTDFNIALDAPIARGVGAPACLRAIIIQEGGTHERAGAYANEQHGPIKVTAHHKIPAETVETVPAPQSE